MANKFTRDKQSKLPELQLREVVASLGYILAARDDRIRWNSETLLAHYQNLFEYLLRESVLPNGEEDVVPF